MKPLRVTLFVIAFLILSSQTFRHAYVRWIEVRTSALDKYKTDAEKRISNAKSLQDLLSAYETAQRDVEKERANKANAGAAGQERVTASQPGDETTAADRKLRLRLAIEEWEGQTKEIRELHMFWIAGLVSLATGLLLFRFAADRWVAISLVILAYSEMIWATCPGFRVFSLISWVLLMFTHRWLQMLEKRRDIP